MIENHTFKNMRYEDYTGVVFSNCILKNADMYGAEFSNCTFHGCDLNAYITGTKFTNCSFTLCEFSHAYIFRSQFKNCVLDSCTMDDTLLSTVDFTGTNFENVHWKGTIINSPPLIIDGIEYPITALDNGWMHVGCEFNTMEYFETRDKRYVASTEGLRSARFWRDNKQWIFDMLRSRGLYE